MPFDPSLPLELTPVDAAQIRGNFNGLKELIDALPGIQAAVIDSVDTLPPGSAATVGLSLTGGTLHLAFGIPQGAEGSQGPQGSNGSDGMPGPQGPQGPQGPPFAIAVVDSVQTLPAGQAAAVNVSFDGTYVRFSFAIPQGSDGPPGMPGPPGEVTNAALAAEITTTARNPATVNTLTGPVAGSYDQAQMQQVYDKVNELINALRR